MGDVTPEEARRCADVVSSWYTVSKGKKEPAQLVATRKLYYLYLTTSVMTAAVALFVKRYSIVWAWMSFIPLGCFTFFNNRRQPLQALENGYNYILA